MSTARYLREAVAGSTVEPKTYEISARAASTIGQRLEVKRKSDSPRTPVDTNQDGRTNAPNPPTLDIGADIREVPAAGRKGADQRHLGLGDPLVFA